MNAFTALCNAIAGALSSVVPLAIPEVTPQLQLVGGSSCDSTDRTASGNGSVGGRGGGSCNGRVASLRLTNSSHLLKSVLGKILIFNQLVKCVSR